jgi:pyrroline-5-carboxylate reductase
MSEKSSVSSELSVAIIGAGNLGSAIAKGIVRDFKVTVTGRRPDVLRELQNLGCSVEKDNRRAAAKCDIVFITVKPKDVTYVLEEIKDYVKDKIVVSFAAMKKIDELKGIIPDSAVVRAMTNIFSELGCAFTSYFTKDEIDTSELEKIISRIGEVHRATSEDEIELMTAFSGSAPAFVAKLIESFIYAGLKCGLDAEISKKVTLSVFKGTSKMVKDTEPESLIRRITTPSGTTIQGLAKLMEYRVDFAIVEALEATARRAKND